MERRRWLLIASGACFAYAWLSSVGYVSAIVGFYPEDQLQTGMLLAGLCLLSWTALEITARLIERRPITCRCGYSMAGVKCPECGRPVGGGGA